MMTTPTPPDEPIRRPVPRVKPPKLVEPDAMSDQSIRDQFTALGASNATLGGDVQALTRAITVVNQLQIDQRETTRKAEELARQVRTVEDESRARSARSQRVALRAAIGFAILLPLASLLVYYVL